MKSTFLVGYPECTGFHVPNANIGPQTYNRRQAMLRLLLEGLGIWFACDNMTRKRKTQEFQGPQVLLFEEFRVLPCPNCTSLSIPDLVTSLSLKGLWPIPAEDSYKGSIMRLVVALREAGQEGLANGALPCNSLVHMSQEYAETTYPKGLLLDVKWGVNNSSSTWATLEENLAAI